MTKEEIVKEIRQLPSAEREAVIEAVSSMREEIQANGSVTETPRDEGSREEKMAAFHRLQGMLKTDVPPPTDEELKQDYINYLAEKYS